ncbi:MAG: OmpA family protein [Bacteroidales bacterium]|nr:OmpA family protein [Bacteroidales bacterium]
MNKILIILLLTLSGQVYSQTLSTKSKKAIQYFNKAFEYYNLYKYEESIYWCEAAINKDKKFIEVYYLLSDIYDETKRPLKKINILKQAVDINPQKSALAFLTLAKTELSIGRYEDAKYHFDELKKYDVLNTYSEMTKPYIKKCIFGINALKNPVDFKPENLGVNINSEFDEYLPTITADEQTLIFTRLIPTGKRAYNGTLEMQEDFFISEKENNTYEEAKEFGSPLNTYSNEGAQSISADGKFLFFTSCEYNKGESPHGKSYGSCDIFVSEKVGDKWSKPENIGERVNTKYWESQPAFSSDGKTLYFVSSRPGGKGGMDIWMTQIQADNTWAVPVNLGNNINTEKHEQSPFIHYDNQTLYFSSNGHLGMGKQDIFISRKDTSGNWQKPVNLGYPINTHDEEVSLIINTKGNKAFFASSKKSKYGGLDLYTFELNEENRPNQVTYVHGTVYDIETSEKLSSKIKLININKNCEVATASSDEETGEFLICLPSGNDYAFNVSKPGYLFYSENFTLSHTSDSLKTYYFRIPLSPIKKGRKTILKNIFFEIDSYKLQKISYAELDKLYDFLINNKSVKIEISGHTDNTGSEQHNNQLSLQRAKSVYDYLINEGIQSLRMTYKGYGSKHPVDTNATKEGRQNNRRTEFKVL